MGSAASVPESLKNPITKPTTHGTLNFSSGDSLAVFAEEMISRSPKVEGLTILLETEKGRDSFIQFLRNEYVVLPVCCSFKFELLHEHSIRAGFLHINK